jgi:gas vesicle structural protein
MSGYNYTETENVSLCEALDRILNKGAVIVGEVVISVANIDLIYLGLTAVLTSIEAARRGRPAAAERQQVLNEYN